jgi:hypothetical protein
MQGDEFANIGLVFDDEDGRTGTDWASHSLSLAPGHGKAVIHK